ncbi:MAG: hypothetical protein K2X11_07355, partial [Acetobacteraceae bacterium]|nr:hypothetical protein [Acetobacteraceae bacterium]
GWALGLDLADAAQLRLLSPAAPVAALRWRYQPGGEAEALRPGWAERAILTGADGAAAIGWGWKHGVARFMGRVVEAG